MISFRKHLFAAAVIALAPASLFAQPQLIKFATLAPQGSAWMNVMEELNAELKKETQGQLGFKIYAGGVAGDEKDVLRKIRIGEVQSGGFTGVGLGEIAPKARIVDAPWLFHNVTEVDFIRKKFHTKFEKAFEDGGFILLGWTDLGFVHFFSRNPFSTPEALKKDKIWIWEGDPIAEAAFKVLGISPIPLSELDVMSSLQTGMIDTVYGPPLAVTALQWFTKTRFIDPIPLAYASGAVLISKSAFDSLDSQQKKILKKLSSLYLNRLNSLSRKENEESIAALQKEGLVLSPQPPVQTLKLYSKMGDEAREALVDKLYSQKFLHDVEKALKDFRKRSGHGRDKKN
jgi:TRAP-type C4-dicarboxylate transport system substrate-binding protein